MVVDQTVRNWLAALPAASKEHRWRHVSGIPYVISDDHVAALEVHAEAGAHRGDRPRLVWSIVIKPTVVDDVLWEAFLPDVEIGARARANRRINGAFRVPPLELAQGERVIELRAEPDWGPVFDEVDTVRTRYLTPHPGLDDFIAASEQDTTAGTGQRLVRTITALIAAGRCEEAKVMAESAIAQGESGLMSSRVDVLHHLAAHASGPEAFADFRRSLEPTHTVELLSDSDRDLRVELAKAHSKGRFAHHLASMDGANPWAMILSTTAEAIEELSYLQAAGTAEAMVVEWCRPTDGDHVAVRSVVGRPGDDALPDLSVVTPHGGIDILGWESFTAAEATALFEEFYHHGTLSGALQLRPVQGFLANGDSVDLA